MILYKVQIVQVATLLFFAASAWGGAPVPLYSPNEQTGDLFGFSVADIGDVNDDGVADVAVGAPHEGTATQAGVGRAYVYSGTTGVRLRTLTSPSPASNGSFGFTVIAMPDVDDDEVPDVVVGAPVELVAGENIGRVHVLSGATGAHVRSFNGPDDGILAGRSFEYGTAVAVYGDANEDGVPDLVVGAPGWSIWRFEPGGGFLSPGRAFLVDGVDGSRIEEYVAPNAAEEGSFGAAVAVLDDITADGHPEVAVGAPTDREGQALPGRVYVVNGMTGVQLYALSSRNPITGGRFGADIDVVEDLNGDGVRDIVVTADNEDAGELEAAGRVYLFSGATGNHMRTIDSPDAEELMFFGTALDVVADYSGDGLDDLVITAGTGTRIEKQESFPLKAFIMNSVNGGVLHRITIRDNRGAPLFGSSAAGIGDTDNDGKEDLVLGSTFGQGGFAARAYIARSRDFAGTVTPPPSIECHGGAERGGAWWDFLAIGLFGLVLWAIPGVGATATGHEDERSMAEEVS